MVRVAVKGPQEQNNLDVTLVVHVLQRWRAQTNLAQLELLPTQQEYAQIPPIKPLVQIVLMEHLRWGRVMQMRQ